MSVISIAMQLGIEPLPAKTSQGRKHIPEGYRETKNLASGATPSVREKASERRNAAIAMLKDGPMTMLDLMGEFEVERGIVDEDLRVIGKTHAVHKKMHKGENLYWVTA